MTFPPLHALVVGTDEESARNLGVLLNEAPSLSFRCTHSTTPDAALELLVAETVDVCLVDELEPGSCLALLSHPIVRHRALPVLVLATHPSLDGDQRAIQAGAADYLAKAALDPALLSRSVRHAITRARRVQEESRIHSRTEHALRERVKELHTLHSTGRLLSRRDLSMEERLQKIVDMIPRGWSSPSLTQARLTLDGRTLETPGFRVTPWMLSAPVPAGDRGESDGLLEIALTAKAHPTSADEPFLPEEGALIQHLALVIGETVARERAAQLLSQTLSRIDEGVLILDSLDDERKVRFMNPAAERILGWNRHDFVGGSPHEAHPYPESFRNYGALARAELAAGRTFRGTFTLRRRDGTLFESEQTVSLLDPDRGPKAGFVAVIRDVSERIRTEVALRESEERFRQIAEHVNDVFWITNGDKSTMEYVSPAYARIWGREPDELYADPARWMEAILSEDRAWVAEASRNQTAGGYDVAYRIRRPDGAVRWIQDRAFPVTDTEGRVTRLIGVAEDVTERRMAEDRFRVLGEEMSDVIMIVGEAGDILFVSPSVEALTGYPVDEFVGFNGLDVVHPDDRPFLAELLERVAAKPGSTARAEFRMLRRDGAIREVESVARNLNDNPAVRGIVITTRDVGERLLLERRIRQGQKMEAVGRLAGGVAHDFNNILTVIRSETELLLLDHPDPPLSDDLEVIRAAADRAAVLVHQLLAFSREQILRPRLVDLGEVVRDMAPLVERASGERVVVEYALSESVGGIMIDPDQLHQVILNLVLNASDAMPHGGTLTLATGEETLDEARVSSLPGLTAGRYALLRVSDTGTGMTPDTTAKIFDPFFTTKPRGRGTGLGLATAYGFMKQSGGGIHVDTEPDRGSTFHLRFPLGGSGTEYAEVESVREEGVADPTGGSDSVQSAPVVLIADDEPAVLQVTHRVLSRAGYAAVAVGSSAAALGALEPGRRVDLLLIDLDLPEAGGRAVAARARALWPGLPILVMSGHGDLSAEFEDAPTGKVTYLRKPFTRDDLLEAVRSALGD